jgi:NADPH:quinone reductase-like Zn-dependent oxidoreductase
MPQARRVNSSIPGRVMLAEATTGACATRVAVPDRNLVDKPAELSFTAAACLPTAWLTAYSMLYRKAQIRPGQTVLVQGAASGVSTAAIALACAGGARVWVVGRSRARLAAARHIGADDIFDAGARLPERVDVVIETVGSATWAHSVHAVRPGGVVVVAGATTGATVETRLGPYLLAARIDPRFDDGHPRRSTVVGPVLRPAWRDSAGRCRLPARGSGGRGSPIGIG